MTLRKKYYYTSLALAKDLVPKFRVAFLMLNLG